jgi:hypothetical protein
MGDEVKTSSVSFSQLSSWERGPEIRPASLRAWMGDEVILQVEFLGARIRQTSPCVLCASMRDEVTRSKKDLGGYLLRVLVLFPKATQKWAFIIFTASGLKLGPRSCYE